MHSTENIYSSIFQYLNEKAMTGTSMFHRGSGETSHGGTEVTEVTSIPVRAEGGDTSAPIVNHWNTLLAFMNRTGCSWQSACDADPVVWNTSSPKRGVPVSTTSFSTKHSHNDKTITASDFSSKHEDEIWFMHDIKNSRVSGAAPDWTRTLRSFRSSV